MQYSLKIKALYSGICLLLCCLSVFAQEVDQEVDTSSEAKNVAKIEGKRTRVIYFSLQNNAQFESRIKPFFEKQTQNCRTCTIINQSPYGENGEINLALLSDKLKNLPEDTSILFFDWNERNSEKFSEFSKLIKKQIQEGRVVIATAGTAEASLPVLPLNITLFGAIEKVVILGELEARDILPARSFFGPRMLTAVRPPRDMLGQGFGPMLFVSKLASAWSKRSANEWLEVFQERKQKSRKIWPELEEFFPR